MNERFAKLILANFHYSAILYHIELIIMEFTCKNSQISTKLVILKKSAIRYDSHMMYLLV